MPSVRGISFTALLAGAALAGGSFLHLRAHGLQIVAGRNYREQYDEHASQSQQDLDGSEAAAVMSRSGVAPQPIGRQGQKQPREIE